VELLWGDGSCVVRGAVVGTVVKETFVYWGIAVTLCCAWLLCLVNESCWSEGSVWYVGTPGCRSIVGHLCVSSGGFSRIGRSGGIAAIYGLYRAVEVTCITQILELCIVILFIGSRPLAGTVIGCTSGIDIVAFDGREGCGVCSFTPLPCGLRLGRAVIVEVGLRMAWSDIFGGKRLAFIMVDSLPKAYVGFKRATEDSMGWRYWFTFCSRYGKCMKYS